MEEAAPLSGQASETVIWQPTGIVPRPDVASQPLSTRLALCHRIPRAYHRRGEGSQIQQREDSEPRGMHKTKTKMQMSATGDWNSESVSFRVCNTHSIVLIPITPLFLQVHERDLRHTISALIQPAPHCPSRLSERPLHRRARPEAATSSRTWRRAVAFFRDSPCANVP